MGIAFEHVKQTLQTIPVHIIDMDDSEQPPDATESTAKTTEATQQTSSTTTKKKRKRRTPKPHVLSQLTLRDPPWSYIRLQHLTSSIQPPDLDAVTAHLHLTAVLSQFLGLHGTAIPFDILKLEGQDVWIRLPHEDSSALIAAVGGWVSTNGEGWRVRGSSSWDASALGKDAGQDLFDD
jgi:ribonuclease P/MRP protein subunit POP8